MLTDLDDISQWQTAFREREIGTKLASASAATSAAAGAAYASGSSFTPTRPWRGNHDNG